MKYKVKVIKTELFLGGFRRLGYWFHHAVFNKLLASFVLRSGRNGNCPPHSPSSYCEQLLLFQNASWFLSANYYKNSYHKICITACSDPPFWFSRHYFVCILLKKQLILQSVSCIYLSLSLTLLYRLRSVNDHLFRNSWSYNGRQLEAFLNISQSRTSRNTPSQRCPDFRHLLVKATEQDLFYFTKWKWEYGWKYWWSSLWQPWLVRHFSSS